MGFWNNEKENKAAEKSAEKVDKAASNPKNPTVLATEEQNPKAAEPRAQTQASGSDLPGYSRDEAGLTERYGVIRSALGKGTVIQGKLSFDTPVRIDGSLNGDVYSSQVLIVGETGVIEADIEVASLIVMGKVKGKIKASQRVELWAGGELEGEINSPVFIIEENSKFNGSCSMNQSAAATQSKKEVEKKSEAKAEKASGQNSQSSSKELRVH